MEGQRHEPGSKGQDPVEQQHSRAEELRGLAEEAREKAARAPQGGRQRRPCQSHTRAKTNPKARKHKRESAEPKHRKDAEAESPEKSMKPTRERQSMTLSGPNERDRTKRNEVGLPHYAEEHDREHPVVGEQEPCSTAAGRAAVPRRKAVAGSMPMPAGPTRRRWQ